MEEIKLPASFSDIVLREYLSFAEGMRTDEVLKAFLPDKPLDYIRSLPTSVAQRAIEHLQSVIAQQQPRFAPRVMLGGKQYGFIPNWEEFTTGEYIDMEMYCDDVYKNALKVCSILYREIESSYKDKYTIVPYTAKEDASVFEELPAENFLGILSFFLTTRERLLSDMQYYLKGVLAETMNSARNGDGIPSSTRSQMMTSFVWKASRSYLSRWYSSTYLS